MTFPNQQMKKQKRPTRKQNGYVLIDALVTVIISTTVFSAVIGGISLAANAVIKSRERILTAIEARNVFEKEPKIQTTRKPTSP